MSYGGKTSGKTVGSFWKTNPPGGVFRWGSVAATTTLRHLVGLVLENEPTGEVFFVGICHLPTAFTPCFGSVRAGFDSLCGLKAGCRGRDC
jgi:hypothetical protein